MHNKVGHINFNMPYGRYEVLAGNLSELKEPVNYPVEFDLPNNFDSFKKLPKIIFCDNPNKCSVDTIKNVIYFDNRFKNCPWVVILWIVGHELAHYFFKTNGFMTVEQRQIIERKCDLFSNALLLKIGFNPSQINFAIKYALSNSLLAQCRKENSLNQLINIQYERSSHK